MATVVGCLAKIRECYATLSPKEQQIADFLLNNTRQTTDMSLKELATASNSSVSSVLRLCRSLQLSGYKELCKTLCGELASLEQAKEFEDIHPGDNTDAVMNHLLLSDTNALRSTISANKNGELEQAVDLLCKADRIDFYGVGSSGLVALDASNKFGRIGKNVVASSDPHTQYITATSLRKGDAVVLISYSGETKDTVSIAQKIRSAGIDVISITKTGPSTIADLANIRLYTSSTETFMRSGAMSSRMCQMFLIDVLYTSVCSRTYDKVKPILQKTRQDALHLHNERIP